MMSVLSCLPRRASAFFAALVVASCAGLAPALAADPTVTISNFAFSPKQTTVAAGSKVIFRNDDDTIHSVVADDGSFHSQALDTGGEFSFAAKQPGTFAYHCGLHPFMQGEIVVQ